MCLYKYSRIVYGHSLFRKISICVRSNIDFPGTAALFPRIASIRARNYFWKELPETQQPIARTYYFPDTSSTQYR
jgi:hypothetical protein